MYKGKKESRSGTGPGFIQEEIVYGSLLLFRFIANFLLYYVIIWKLTINQPGTYSTYITYSLDRFLTVDLNNLEYRNGTKVTVTNQVPNTRVTLSSQAQRIQINLISLDNQFSKLLREISKNTCTVYQGTLQTGSLLVRRHSGFQSI
jgi:hypothetical protein